MTAVIPASTLPPLSAEAISVLRRAATNTRTWQAAQRDPKAFLRERGVLLPDDLHLELYELKVPPSGLTVLAGDLKSAPSDDARASTQFMTTSSGRDAWWASTHEGCPLGTYPFKTTRQEWVCLRKGRASTGVAEWVPGPNGNHDGHFERQTIDVCLQSEVRTVQVTDCSPLLLREVLP